MLRLLQMMYGELSGCGVKCAMSWVSHAYAYTHACTHPHASTHTHTPPHGHISTWNMHTHILTAENLYGIKIRTFGYSGKFKRRSLIIMNHVSHLDWMYLWSVIDRQGDLSYWKVIAKRIPIRSLPILGMQTNTRLCYWSHKLCDNYLHVFWWPLTKSQLDLNHHASTTGYFLWLVKSNIMLTCGDVPLHVISITKTIIIIPHTVQGFYYHIIISSLTNGIGWEVLIMGHNLHFYRC